MQKILLKSTIATAILLSAAILNAGNLQGIFNTYEYPDDGGDTITTVTAFKVGDKGISTATVNGDKTGFYMPTLVSNDFSKEQGWDSAKHLVIQGAGHSDTKIIGFGDKGTTIVSLENDEITGKKTINSFGYNQGWRKDKHIRRIGTACSTYDIVGYGDKGVIMSRYDAITKKYTKTELVLNDFGYNQGWRNDKHVRLMANFGTMTPTIVGFGDEGVFVTMSDYNYTTKTYSKFEKPKLWLSDFGYDQGWRNDKHIRMLAYLDYSPSNSSPSIIGFGEDGVSIAKVNADKDGFEKRQLILADFGDNQGWEKGKHLRMLVDATGDYRNDIVGFKDNNVYVSKGKDDGTFEAKTLWLANGFGDNQGWRVTNKRILFDINGDNYKDIVGFKNNQIYVSLNNKESEFLDPKLWEFKENYSFLIPILSTLLGD